MLSADHGIEALKSGGQTIFSVLFYPDNHLYFDSSGKTAYGRDNGERRQNDSLYNYSRGGDRRRSDDLYVVNAGAVSFKTGKERKKASYHIAHPARHSYDHPDDRIIYRPYILF